MKCKDTINEEQLKCLEAVQRINNELHDKEGWDNHNTLMSIAICSYFYFVTINLNSCDAEINLFNSSNDDSRIYYEKADKYEEWYSFLKRRFREVKSEINNIKL